MTLIEFIKENPSLNDQQIIESRNVKVVPIKDNTLWTYKGLIKHKSFSVQLIGALDEILKRTPGFDWIRISLSSVGLDFSDSATQAAIDLLVTNQLFSPEVGSDLKSVGVFYISEHELEHGTGQVCTNLHVNSARNSIARRTAEDWARERYGLVVQAINNGECDCAALNAVWIG